ncbi:hypothetical protein GCM10012275_63210 [Longimycelium tulufanense]|uniref:Uncharacterized protein n=1 Tax=Longimycelium tulufanense TaxID=907463 RepID=A0A8J3CL90_9PSEU|nr:hypothetical protein [Longimycelium tulufanense]GGM83963.1 hypothetical protein GCM10012275_63210 [Longimycelium tulufanense]
MASVGDWVRLARDVGGAPAGARGRVTSTGFFGDVDLELEDGRRLTGVPSDAVASAGDSGEEGGTGCVVLGLVLLGTAVTAAATWWGGNV